MEKIVAHVSSKGQVVVPAAMRRHLGLEKGATITWRLEGESAVLEPATDKPKTDWSKWAREMRGLDPQTWKGVDVVKYIKDQRDRGYDT